MKKILFVVGSLRKGSFNKQLAELTKELIGNRAEVSCFSLEGVPFINQDEEYPASKGVQDLRDAVNASDALWLFTPEYNGQIPGLLKNAVDWLSRPLKPFPAPVETTIKGKKVTYSGAGGGAGTGRAQETLKTLLTNIGADILSEPTAKVVANQEAWATSVVTFSEEQKKQIQSQIDSFLKFIA